VKPDWQKEVAQASAIGLESRVSGISALDRARFGTGGAKK